MNLSRAIVSSFTLVAFSGCFWHQPVAVTAPVVVSNLKFDPAILGKDPTGLTWAAERLCSPITSADQKLLGFALAQKAYALSPHNNTAALALARCAAMRVDWETDHTQIEAIAELGIEAARSAGAPDRDPRASYWMAINLGQTLLQRGFSALPLLPVEVSALKTAQAAGEIELGGPLRALGMLYLKAPSWPAGPGDLDAALEILKQAVETYPSHPLNHLFYAQALRESGDAAQASRELKRASELARAELWGDYAARWQADVQAAAK